VALCEQTETPQTKTTKGPLKRAVVRILTPGTLTEENHLDPKAHHFIGCIVGQQTGETGWGVSLLDLSTGDFFTEYVAETLSDSGILHWGPREMLLPETLQEDGQLRTLKEHFGWVSTPLPW
jgi:DNA mismatch repair protein MutS